MDDNSNKAGWYYHHPDYRYNCAQAIAHCWSDDKSMIAEMRLHGSGRAANGYCGAFYAAKQVSEKMNLDRVVLESRFLERTGSLVCREIRAKRSVSCKECVDVAHDILTELSSQKSDK